MVPKSWWLTGLVGLVVLATLPVAAHLVRGDRGDRCAWDGLELEPIYQVRIVEEAGFTAKFCCLHCAEMWLLRRDASGVSIFVTDEASGAELEASDALFIRSTVVTNAVTGNRRHAFRRIEDASKHAAAAHGRRLLGDERPFAKMNVTNRETRE